MPSLVSIFLYGFLLDALLSVASDWLPIALLREIVAWAVFGLSLVLFPLTAFLPQLPKRLILPPFFFLIWAIVCGAFPLAFVAPDHFQTTLAWSQLVLAIALLTVHWHWRRTPPKLDANSFSWQGFALVTVLALLATPLVLIVALANSAGVYLEARSGGYVKLRPEGLVLEERELTKGDKRVRLVSMIHIGEKSFYDHILGSMPRQGAATVLLEGVTDDQGLLKGRFSYTKIADLLGLSSQESSSFQRDGKAASSHSAPDPAHRPRLEYRRADVDISVFQPLTLEFMNAIGAILAEPTAANFLRTVQDPDSPFQQPNADEVVMHDILDKRNEHLIGEIDRALETSQTVVVPWGALHLPAIEASLKDRGFQETGHVSRPVIHFWRKSPAPATQ